VPALRADRYRRAHLYLQRLNRLLRSGRAAASTSAPFKPFDFYIDLTDGTRLNSALWEQLGVPILSVSRSPSDRHTLPVPDIDMLLGVYTDWDYSALPDPRDQQLFAAATECEWY
jgi:hypothetical protein